MKLIDRYEFTNGARLETWLLESADIRRYNLPECDVIGLRRVGENEDDRMTMMRPDEALIMAQMLTGAVRAVTEGYSISIPVNDDNQQAFAAERE